jgi:hypothetical protein
MDTFKIIKELTAKTDMLSVQPLKDNFKALLPIASVHKGWATYTRWKFDFKPRRRIAPHSWGFLFIDI